MGMDAKKELNARLRALDRASTQLRGLGASLRKQAESADRSAGELEAEMEELQLAAERIAQGEARAGMLDAGSPTLREAVKVAALRFDDEFSLEELCWRLERNAALGPIYRASVKTVVNHLVRLKMLRVSAPGGCGVPKKWRVA